MSRRGTGRQMFKRKDTFSAEGTKIQSLHLRSQTQVRQNSKVENQSQLLFIFCSRFFLDLLV